MCYFWRNLEFISIILLLIVNIFHALDSFFPNQSVLEIAGPEDKNSIFISSDKNCLFDPEFVATRYGGNTDST